MTDGMQRRLAAILAADVVGYTRLMEADEEGTRRRFNGHFAEIIEPAIAKHGGRLVKTTGDGLLIEHTSVVDAVACAVAIQSGTASRDVNLSRDRQMRFRIGVNLGDVLVEGDDIHGEGVNVAARLEGLADPGGICISGGVHDQVRNRIDVDFEDLGERTVKNLSSPVRVYKILTQSTRLNEPTVDVSTPVKGFTGRPAIAVLPFDNMSGDPEQEFFVDGLTEDLILRLSYWRWFPIIARNSTFAFKGQSPDIKDVGEKLGARYVVEGSVRKAAKRIRVAAQLIDASNGHQVWAERYDRELEDIFAVQDEITDRIVGALEPAIGVAEQQRARIGNPDNLDAWEACHRGLWYYYRANKEDSDTARSWFLRSIELDPEFALPWGALSMLCFTELVNSFTDDVDRTLKEMRIAGNKSTAISDVAARGHLGTGWTEIFAGHHAAGVREMQCAIENNPSFAPAYFYLGLAELFAGNAEQALESIERALRLSPRDPLSGRIWSGASVAHFVAGNRELAIDTAKKAISIAPDLPVAQRDLAVALANAGRTDEAKSVFDTFMRLAPDYSAAQMRKTMPFKNIKDYEPAIDCLRELGLPDG
jgi:adenylate cyclase